MKTLVIYKHTERDEERDRERRRERERERDREEGDQSVFGRPLHVAGLLHI